MQERRSRKRGAWRTRTFALLLFLLLGTASTIAVAWIAALTWSPQTARWYIPSREWPYPPVDPLPPPEQLEALYTVYVTSESASLRRFGEPGLRTTQAVIDDSVVVRWYGVPARALLHVTQMRGLNNVGSRIERGRLRSGIVIAGFGGPNDIRLPLLPVWPGFAVDTAIFGGAWAIASVLPTLAWRRVRKHFGHCPRCGYDLRNQVSLQPCPECGCVKSTR